jgi:hypothetical protein
MLGIIKSIITWWNIRDNLRTDKWPGEFMQRRLKDAYNGHLPPVVIPIAGESLAEYWERRIKSGDYSILTGVTWNTIEFTDLSELHFSPAPKDGKLLDGCFIHTSK